MCNHYYKFEPQGQKLSRGTCAKCGAETEGLNGFPDNAYNFDNVFPLESNPKRVMDNDVERILNDRRYPHIFDRHL
jgi:hypothetical protein